jgi:hypothetical protein
MAHKRIKGKMREVIPEKYQPKGSWGSWVSSQKNRL